MRALREACRTKSYQAARVPPPCVSNLLASGLSVRVVARWVGDTERMVQDTYSYLLPNEKDVTKDFFDGLDDINSDGDSENE